MNGRVYDPKLGRMLSPDPVTQAPENGQNYNRYSYAYNNPLKHTDSSGYATDSDKPNTKPTGGTLDWRSVGAKGATGFDGAGNNTNLPPSLQGNAGLASAGSGSADVPKSESGDVVDAGGSPTPSSTPVQDVNSQSGGGFWSAVADVTGKIWSSPNTVIGIAFGATGHLVGEVGQVLGLWDKEPSVGFGNNALEFTGNPFAGGGAIALGNTITWGVETGDDLYKEFSSHERVHTVQGQIMGPLYIPANVVAMTASTLTYPFPSTRRTVRGASFAHGKLNFMEGPILVGGIYQ